MEYDTPFRPRLGVCNTVEYVQTLIITSSSSRKLVLLPLGFHRSRCAAVLLGASTTTKHEYSACTIMCVGTGADRRVCMLATRDLPFR